MRGRKYKVLSGMVYENRIPKIPNTLWNCVEFIEVREDIEMGERVEVEIVPQLLPKEDTIEQQIHNDFVRICGTKCYPTAYLERLISDKVLELL